MIANSIRAQYGGSPQTSFMYSKPYTKRIDNLRMPLGIKRRPISHAVRSKLKRKYFRVACLQHDGVNKHQTAEGRVSHRLQKPIESSKLGLQRQAHRTVCSGDVHPRKTKNVYPFPDSNVADMLEQLIEKQLIQLPECKRSEQAGKVDDPNYCKYHRVISHSVERCFVLKELILKLACENKIELDIDEVAQTNHVAVKMTSRVLPSMLLYDKKKSLIQFGTFEPYLFDFNKR
ncbi:retrotransposon gag protein [Cucumis melo var. makuwa]|uniref:Retrotransposon gag protein n=1 Tax=Cucumis melo var. makuwa TaxID=1194695 RepID=A0A5A7UF02_CUCMM|nr:retrotransposon gag protein [Cucumis melo var. makuwa]TYK00705.1 retrotransposon gag protein [Cucumis melo var. makuwa]